MRKYALFYHHRHSNEVELFKDHLTPYLTVFSLRENKNVSTREMGNLLSYMDYIELSDDEYVTCMLKTVRKHSSIFPSLMFHTHTNQFIYYYERNTYLRAYFLISLQDMDNQTKWLKQFTHKQ